MDTSINKDFLVAVMKLKRDSLNFKSLGIDKSFELRFSETDAVGFSHRTNNWTVRTIDKSIENWNPSVSDIFALLLKYDESQIRNAIRNFNSETDDSYSRINGKILLPKFLQILDLLKFEENSGILIKFEELFFGYEDFSYFTVNKTGDKFVITENEISDFLNQLTYLKVVNVLSDTYARLKRKI
jgi:hypothetical protein